MIIRIVIPGTARNLLFYDNSASNSGLIAHCIAPDSYQGP